MECGDETGERKGERSGMNGQRTGGEETWVYLCCIISV